MHDIKIPDPLKKKPEFAVTHLDPADTKATEPGEKVKVKFKNFVELVATHDFEEVIKHHADEDIIVSTNLLTDLANAHEEVEDHAGKKLSLSLVTGILIGVVITYLIIRFT